MRTYWSSLSPVLRFQVFYERFHALSTKQARARTKQLRALVRSFMNPARTDILLVNLGTPRSASIRDVRSFLHEFLSDPYVIDIPAPARQLLLQLAILPFRPRISALAYQKIWTPRGSPLLFHTADLTAKVAAVLGADFDIQFAMRYGEPSIRQVLPNLLRLKPERLIVLPLYPQYAASTTESTLTFIKNILKSISHSAEVHIVPPFYNNPEFISCFVSRGRQTLGEFSPDHTLFSFHGLPEQHIRKIETSKGFCLNARFNCCSSITASNARCYRAQCAYTAREMAKQLNFRETDYTISFQSRLGPVSWIKPYTSEVIPQLAKAGKKKLLVFSPSFVADCVETLEEINIRGKDSFLASGGEDLRLVPSLNSGDDWAKTIAQMAKAAI